MFIIGFIGIIFGIVFFLFFQKYSNYKTIRHAKNLSQDILQEADNKGQLLFDQARFTMEERLLGLRKTLISKVENVIQENRQLQSFIDKKNHKHKMDVVSVENKLNQKEKNIQYLKNDLEKIKKFQNQIRSQLNESNENYLKILQKNFQLDGESSENNIRENILNEFTQRENEKILKKEEEDQQNLERNISLILTQVLSRFQRSHCSERGIAPIHFKSLKFLNKLLGRERSFLDIIEKDCGVDVIVDTDNLSLSVQGLDPVRREWGRFVIQKLSKKNFINTNIVLSLIKNIKRELFSRIKRDGKKICSNLNLRISSPEIKNMLGSLRYRYSFAQNQYFHCEEVSWLCGMLMSEIGERYEDGRRAGLFHDIGKAMDHAKTGGHAVIGADFIKKHGENPRIVYAVRAHHYDVTPNNLLDHLVIAADAISGSRPGARRSTIEAYHQKVSTLEKIGKSFKGVKDVYIMNAGREVRVIVNSKVINDVQSLHLSKKITQRIEEECSYPGWIKVTVLRKVETSQLAHG